MAASPFLPVSGKKNSTMYKSAGAVLSIRKSYRVEIVSF
jgi:hypothetical protein